MLGLKILLVALLTTVLIGDPIGARLWTAAALSTVAIALLNIDRGHPHSRVGTTICSPRSAPRRMRASTCSIQKWSPAWGAGRFLPIAMGCAAVYSLPLRSYGADLQTARTSHGNRLRAVAHRRRGCFALQGLMFITSISIYGNATIANVLYSSRGLWSVVAVWAVGHWFSNREQHLGARVLVWRLLGAVLLMIALLIVLLSK